MRDGASILYGSFLKLDELIKLLFPIEFAHAIYQEAAFGSQLLQLVNFGQQFFYYFPFVFGQ